MRVAITVGLSGAMAAPALAADINLNVEIPRLSVAEYHRPYVAIWLERPDQSFVGNVAVWYDLKLKDNEGTKWLKDLRQWWRRSGRELAMPVDGLSTATRPPGEHQISVALDRAPFAGLGAGEYQVVIEAAREVGGREILRIPLQWPPKTPETLKIKGEHELGAVAVDLKP
jgi:hypothetical protein